MKCNFEEELNRILILNKRIGKRKINTDSKFCFCYSVRLTWRIAKSPKKPVFLKAKHFENNLFNYLILFSASPLFLWTTPSELHLGVK